MQTQPGPLAERDFRAFWGGQTISIFGSQITLIALPLVAVDTLHATSGQMGILAALGSLPLLFFGLFAGVWVDRFDRRLLMIGADIARTLLLGALVTAIVSRTVDSMALLYTISFTVGSFGVVFNTAYQAFLPSLTARENLIAANSRLTQSRSVAQVSGPPLGGALVQALGAPLAIVGDAASFLMSALLLTRIPSRESQTANGGGERERVLRHIRGGLVFVARSPLLRGSAGCAGTYTLFFSMIVALRVLYFSRELGLRPAWIGVVLGAAGPGTLLGSFIAVRMARRFGVGRVLTAGVLLAGIANSAFPVVTGSHRIVLGLLVVAFFVSGFGQPLYNITQSSLRQTVVPPALQGRVAATMQFLGGCAAPVGAVLGGFLGEVIGLRLALVAGGLGTIGATVWLLSNRIHVVRSLSDIECTTE